ncbi:hypothetical protein LTY36_04965 [Limosilactobacillus agrestis]|uniref:BppU N-terminal domain-containing protein n=1 Tax=Limosilactobacillus agrestis TaxID=2759748 RepID=A0ABS8R6X8_9LACO|nr:hypothetical protein [Limosilactobacillus agrestis]MCD7130541.1 hypothetical protein [Limosilactobacillus agrestis]
MNDVKVFDELIQKRTEGTQRFRFRLIRDNNTFSPDHNHQYQVSFATQKSLVKTVQMKIVGNDVQFDSGQLIDLPMGVYRLEIWEVINDQIHSIYPSDRMLKFTNKINANDLPVGTVSSLTLDEFIGQFKKALKDIKEKSSNVEASIDTDKRTITINGKSLIIPEPINLSGLASKDDIAGLVKQTELAEYIKKNDLPSIPNMTDYVKKEELPKQPDLAKYALKSDLPDLTGYAKMSDLPSVTDLVKKSELANYATKDDLKTVTSNTTRHGPTGFYLDRTTNPMRYVFDNGCTITLKSGFDNAIAGDGFGINEYVNSIEGSWPLANSIMSYAHGTVTPKIIEDTHSSPYAVYNGVIITDPVNDATVWNWDNVFFNDKDRQDFLASPNGMWGGHTDYQKYGEREYIRMLYSLGLMDETDIQYFGAVKKEG